MGLGRSLRRLGRRVDRSVRRAGRHTDQNIRRVGRQLADPFEDIADSFQPDFPDDIIGESSGATEIPELLKPKDVAKEAARIEDVTRQLQQKRRGRASTILTSGKGIDREDTRRLLGFASLLGR